MNGDRKEGRSWISIAGVAAICIITIGPLPFLGITNGYDVIQHFRLAEAYRDAISDGSFLPGWSAPENFGFGSASVRIYPPLADYLMALLHTFTANWYATFTISAFFWVFAGCWGMYRWAREELDERSALFAVFVYAILPYHILQIYQKQLFSEFAATSIMPFCFWFATRVIRRKQWTDGFLLAVSYSALVLTHIPLTVLGTLSLAVYCAFLIDWKDARKTIVILFASAILGLSATSFYWLMVVSESGFTQMNDPQFSKGIFYYGQYLFPIIYSANEHYWLRLLWLFDIPLLLTFLFLLLPGIFLIFLRKGKELNQTLSRGFSSLFMLGAFLTFMMSVPSSWIWAAATQLQKVQFPWRFLAIGTCVGAMLAAHCLKFAAELTPTFKRFFIYASITLIFAVFLFDVTQGISPDTPIVQNEFESKLAEKRSDEACSCFWPNGANKSSFDDRVSVFAAGRRVAVTKWNRELREFHVLSGAPVNARIATFWYPYWHATVNSKEVTLGKDENGAILVPLNEEDSNVAVFFREPSFLVAARYLSTFVWIGIVMFLLITCLRRKTQIFSLPVIN